MDSGTPIDTNPCATHETVRKHFSKWLSYIVPLLLFLLCHYVICYCLEFPAIIDLDGGQNYIFKSGFKVILVFFAQSDFEVVCKVEFKSRVISMILMRKSF